MAITGKRSWRASAFTYVPLGKVHVPTAVEFTMAGELGDPDITGRFEIRGGRPECVELRISAHPTGRDIRTADIKGMISVGVDKMTEEAFARFAVKPNADGSWTWNANELDPDGKPIPKPPWDVEPDVDLAWIAARELAERRKSHRPVSRQELEQVAAIYRAHIDGNPTAEVAKVLGYKSARTAFRRVKEAETAGLLPPTTQGRKRRDV